MTTPSTTPSVLLNAVAATAQRLQEHQELAGKPWVVGYSGGVDSTALLHALHTWCLQQAPTARPTLVAVWVNHGWRPAPASELASVITQCRQWSIPLNIAPTSRLAKPTETAARDHRYQALAQMAQRLGSQTLWVGHHADDQIETLLMRLCRGTGLEGMAGMQTISPVPYTPHLQLARPWLTITKAQLTEYAQSQKLLYSDDPTNNDTSHPRNQMRHQVLPALTHVFPQVNESLLRFQALAYETAELANQCVDNVWPLLWNDLDETLNSAALSQLSSALQGAVIRRFLKHHGLANDYNTVQRVRAFVTGTCSDASLPVNTVSGHQLSVESLDSVETNTLWFLALKQHHLAVTTRSNTPSTTSPPLAEPSLTLLKESPSFQAVAFRLMDLFPLRRPPTATSEDLPDTDDTPLNITEDPLLDEDEAPMDLAPALAPKTWDTTHDATATDPSTPDAEALEVTPEQEPHTTDDLTPLTLMAHPIATQGRPKRQQLVVMASTTPPTPTPEPWGTLTLERVSGDDPIPSPLPSAQQLAVYVSLDAFTIETLTLRPPRPGDRIHPLGKMTTMPLVRYQQTLPPSIRQNAMAVLACGDEVLWIPGVVIAEALRVHRRPSHQLSWQWASTPSHCLSATHQATPALV
ncbi:MAG: tRNA lysidine(34) synthetase TilS [Vampirovibrionales bacterium]